MAKAESHTITKVSQAVATALPAKRSRKPQLPAKLTQRPRFGETLPGRGAPDFRALTTFEKLEPHHATFQVGNDDSAPHLLPGEYAVIDTADRELQHGELYLIQYETGDRPRMIVQITASRLHPVGGNRDNAPIVWWTCALRGFRQTSKMGGIPIFSGLSDGPHWTKNLQSRLSGRVVGVASSPLGELLAPRAGWENEEAGNAAFDPAEYVDAFLAAGYRPYVLIGRDGRTHYFEHFPERRQSEAQEDAVLSVRYKWCAASTALARVEAECMRRGLVEGPGIVLQWPDRNAG
jgi:hypothetical protein